MSPSDPQPISAYTPDLSDDSGEGPGRQDEAPAIDLDAFGQRYLAETVRKAAIQRFSACCPEGFRAENTRWDDPRLAANFAQIEEVRAWEFNRVGILASGPTGRGKTRSMFALYQKLAITQGIDVRYYHASGFFTELQSRVKYDRDEARGWIEAVSERAIVFLDDYGQEAVQRNREDWAASWFFRFLDLRIERGLPLLMTTNLDAEAIATGSTPKAALRSDPLIRRLIEVSKPVRFV
jgi:DNA replication protein DnaC